MYADLINPDLTARRHPDSWTLKYSALPYVAKGRSFAGVDCWGLIWLVFYTELGIDVGQFGEMKYSRAEEVRENIHNTILAKAEELHWEKVAGQVPIEGRAGHFGLKWIKPVKILDVVLIKFGQFATHVGLMCSRTDMLHILEGTKVTIEDITRPTWKGRIYGVYRHPLVEVVGVA